MTVQKKNPEKTGTSQENQTEVADIFKTSRKTSRNSKKEDEIAKLEKKHDSIKLLCRRVKEMKDEINKGQTGI